MFFCDFCGKDLIRKEKESKHDFKKRRHCDRVCAAKNNIRTEEHNQHLSEAKKGNRNSMWKGDNVKMEGLHQWIKSYKPKPKLCELCKKKPPHDLANISGKYMRDINDFEWLCRRCHMFKDGRLYRLHIFLKNRRNFKVKHKKICDKIYNDTRSYPCADKRASLSGR